MNRDTASRLTRAGLLAGDVVGGHSATRASPADDQLSLVGSTARTHSVRCNPDRGVDQQGLREKRVKYRSVLRAIVSILPIVGLTACTSNRTPGASAMETTTAPGQGLVLQAGEGERRVRRNAGKGPFIIKVDGRTPGLLTS